MSAPSLAQPIEQPSLSVRRFFRSVFARADGAAAQPELPWRQQSVDQFFAAAFAPESLKRAGASCGVRVEAADDFFADFQWD
jgi:hypothetical protein